MIILDGHDACFTFVVRGSRGWNPILNGSCETQVIAKDAVELLTSGLMSKTACK